MKKRRYFQLTDGDGYHLPRHRGYRTACCDCGLVHTIDFKVIKIRGRVRVAMRVARHERATAAVRRGAQYRKRPTP